MKRVPYETWDTLDGLSGTIRVGRDEHDCIETKVVIFDTGDVKYILSEYQKRIKPPSPQWGEEK